MKFVRIPELNLTGYLDDNRVILSKMNRSVITLGCLVEVRKDFNYINANFQVVSANDSVQIRPKAIYYDKTKGKYYIKEKGKIKYLDNTEEIKNTIQLLRDRKN